MAFKRATKSRDLYQEVTDKIIAELETGAAPWVKPWRATAGANSPMNITTKRPYSGVNITLLWMAMSANGWSRPHFLTFNQAKEVGGNVKGGEHGTKVYFVKKLIKKEKLDDGSEELRQFPMLREYTVFNIAQCENLPDRMMNPEPVKPMNQDQRDALIEEFIVATKAVIREGSGEAFYSPGTDFISMPRFESFKSADHFNGVRFHELTHWTGHQSRLDRKLRNRFGDNHYAAEELIAELGSAFLSAEFDIDGDLRHAGYIETWIGLLKSDPKAIFTASSAAQKAADFLRGLALKEDEIVAEEEISEAA